MKKFLFVIVGALAAVIVVLATNYQRLTKKPIETEVVSVHVVEDDEGNEIGLTDRPPDPGQRQEIATQVKQTSAMKDSEWTKNFSFRNSQGTETKSEDLKGHPYVTNFFYSECPSSCKKQTDQVRLLQQKYRETPLQFVSITVDPEIDTPEKLAVYADAAGAIPGKWHFLTGDMDRITRVGGEMFLLGAIQRRGHPDRLCLVDADGTLVGKYNWHDPAELKALNDHIDELLKKTNASTESKL